MKGGGICACVLCAKISCANLINPFIYQSPLILTEPNKRFLSHGMLPLSGHDDVAHFEMTSLMTPNQHKHQKLRHDR